MCDKAFDLGVKYLVFEHYCGGNPPQCADCGDIRLRELVLDHVQGGGTADRLAISGGNGGMRYYGALRRRGYPDDKGLEVRCYSCHRARHKREGVEVINLSLIPASIVFDHNNPIPDVRPQMLWEEEDAS